MLRLALLLVLAFTLTACDRDVVREDTAVNPMDAANDETAFSDLVDGHSIVLTAEGDGPFVCMRFIGPGRFESYGPDYAPDEAELALRLTFASEIGGAFEYNYAEGDDMHPAVEGDFGIVEGRIGGADCEGRQE